MPDLDLADPLASWQTHLQAERKSVSTVRMYIAGVRGFLAWCEQQGRPAVLDRSTVNAFVADLLRQGAEAATARARQLAVRRFASWLAEEGELPDDPLLSMRPPKLDQKVVPVLSDGELRRLVKACEGKTFRDRRDEALVRLMAETGMRAGECIALQLGDVDVRGGLVVVRRGKGGRGRVVPFGPATARALDRWLRLRRTHVLAHTDRLWLGEQGRGFSYAALRVALGARARAAGIARFTPHVCGIRPRTDGWPPAAQKAALWPWPAGPAAKCSTATPRRPARTAPPPKPASSTLVTCRRARNLRAG